MHLHLHDDKGWRSAGNTKRRERDNAEHSPGQNPIASGVPGIEARTSM